MTDPLDPTIAQDILALKLKHDRSIDLRPGSKAREVIASALRAQGYLPEAAEGDALSKEELRDAVEIYQKDHGLEDDGRAGRMTLAELKRDARAALTVTRPQAAPEAAIIAPAPQEPANSEQSFRENMLKNARSHMGEDNKDRKGDRVYAPYGEWCAGYAQKNLKDSCAVAGVQQKFLIQVTTHAEPDNYSAYKQKENAEKIGAFHPKTHARRHAAADRGAQPGDFLLFFHDGNPERGHVTMVEKVLHDAHGQVSGYTCIGGNVGNRVRHETYKATDPDLLGHVDTFAVLQKAEGQQKHAMEIKQGKAAQAHPMPAISNDLLMQLREGMNPEHKAEAPIKPLAIKELHLR